MRKQSKTVIPNIEKIEALEDRKALIIGKGVFIRLHLGKLQKRRDEIHRAITAGFYDTDLKEVISHIDADISRTMNKALENMNSLDAITLRLRDLQLEAIR